jgi:hypothetical protein
MDLALPSWSLAAASSNPSKANLPNLREATLIFDQEGKIGIDRQGSGFPYAFRIAQIVRTGRLTGRLTERPDLAR